MAYGDDHSPGAPLAHFREHGADVRLYCVGCALTRDLPLEAVIARLRARGVGDESTGIRRVQAFVRSPCPRCGGRLFETTPAYRRLPLAADQLPPPQ